jgi:hypothetical protein
MPVNTRSESGAVAVIVTIVLTSLLVATAFVVDLGALRADRIEGKVIADMAATAAAIDYRPGDAGAAQQACEDALEYAVANLRGASGTPVADPGRSCAEQFPSTYVCSPGDDRWAYYTIGPYDIEIRLPVRDDPAGDGLDGGLLEDLAHGDDFDGAPCDRIGVRIYRDRGMIFGGVTGFALGTTSPGSVSKVWEDDGEEFASLVVLRRTGCQTLDTGGNSQLRVNRISLPKGDYQGIITLDTQPLGCADKPNQNNKIIRSYGSGLVWADGEIRSYALGSTDPDNTYTYQPGAVGVSRESPSNLWPRPQAGEMVTRALIDHRYNCRPEGYPISGGESYEPSDDQPIDPCDDESPPDRYMKFLHDWLASASFDPAGWHNPGPAVCNKGSAPIPITGQQRVFIDCPGGFEPRQVTITGARYVVVNGSLNMNENAQSFEITGPADGGTVLVFRNGDITRTGGNLRWRNVFTYAVSGELDMRGTSGDIRWEGPAKLSEAELPGCMSTPGQPRASCFGPLAYWGNGAVDNKIAGDAKGGIIGTVFTPNAVTAIYGSQPIDATPCSEIPTWASLAASTSSLNLTGAQFFSKDFDLRGGAKLRMCPNPNLLSTPGWSSNLIR